MNKQQKAQLIRALNTMAAAELEDNLDRICPYCGYRHSSIPQSYRDKCRQERKGRVR